MKIKITIEIETDSAPSPDTVEKANTQADLREWLIDEPTTTEGVPWTDLDQAIIEAATIPELLKIQEQVNAQIGRPKANYNDGRKIHSCATCGAEHRRSLERLNGCCLDCHGVESGSHGGV
mgnify:CR=1 FL=1|tara:strand:+ start:1003 stop:1365 length:363 start_codon:yes stop_codon:yes gene_type:complete